MDTEGLSHRPAKWLSLPIIAAISRLLCRELTLQNEYLRLENKMLKSGIRGRIKFTDQERRTLVDAALAMGRKLMESVVNILRKNGLPPSPERKGLTWSEFLSRHAEVFLCADLLTKEVGHDMGESEVVGDRYVRVGAIQCQQFLGGLLKSYSRKVA